MDRRVVLAGFAAAVAAPALAQQGSATAPSGTSPGAMRSGMGPAEMQHAHETMRLGMVALETSRVAQEKAGNADLKQFAQFEIQEQQTLSEILGSMMDPSTTAATGSGQATSMPMGGTAMDPQGREMVQKLQQASGGEFDRQYLQGQLQGHRDLLQVQERYLQSNSPNREHMNLAKMARGQIRQHIALLEDMQKTVR